MSRDRSLGRCVWPMQPCKHSSFSAVPTAFIREVRAGVFGWTPAGPRRSGRRPNLPITSPSFSPAPFRRNPSKNSLDAAAAASRERVKSWCFMKPAGEFLSGEIREHLCCFNTRWSHSFHAPLLVLARRNHAMSAMLVKQGKFPLESLQAVVFSCTAQTGERTHATYIFKCLFYCTSYFYYKISSDPTFSTAAPTHTTH